MTRLRSLLRHLTYANVVATLALFIAIGGSSYAALSLGSRDVADNSLRSRDIRNNDLRSRDVRNRGLLGRDLKRDSLSGAQIKEGTLGQVPAARSAERLGGLSALDLKVRCPSGTVLRGGGCIEEAARPAVAFGRGVDDVRKCWKTASRSTPSCKELGQVGGIISPEGEWTSNVYQDASNPDGPSEQLEVVVVVPNQEGVDFRQANTPDQLPFRCVALPSN